MNSHQRKKLRKKQELERRTLGTRFTGEDNAIYYNFFKVVRKLLNLNERNTLAYWTSGTVAFDARGKALTQNMLADAFVKAMTRGLRE